MLARRRGAAWLLTASAAAVVVGAGSVVALAAPPPGGPRPLAVSVPTEPTSISPGASATVKVRVINPGTAGVTVTISGASLQFGDNGQVTVESGPDPAWQGLVDYPTGPSTIPAQSYIETALTIRMPAQISPDLYFIAFLVTPAATGQGNIQIINQIGSFVTVDVPGPRIRELAATLDASGFVFGTRTDGTVRVHNVGHAAARFWAESDTTSNPGGGTSHQQRIDKLLLPTGHSRSFTVSGKPAWPVGFVTMTVRITYPDQTEVATKELLLTKRVLVVNPIAVAVLLALISFAVTWSVRHRKRKRRKSDQKTPINDRGEGAIYLPS